MATAAFSKKEALFSSEMDLNSSNKLVSCCIWSEVLCGVENLDSSEIKSQIPENI